MCPSMIREVLVEVCSVFLVGPGHFSERATMLRKVIVLCVVLSLSLLAFGQENSAQAPKAEIFGGYQFVRATTGISGVSGFNLNGWNTSASGFFSRNFGVT